jgi:hypothetical protein
MNRLLRGVKSSLKQSPVHDLLGKLQSSYRVRANRTRIGWRTYWQYGRKYRAPVDPFRLLWVDPQAIGTGLSLTRSEFMAMREQFGVKPGDWDLSTYDLTDHWVYTSFEDHFLKGVPWEKTVLYNKAVREMRAGNWYYHGCTTVNELQLRLWEIDAFYARIEAHGYKTQAQLEHARGPLSHRRRRPPELDEILVSIGRDGEIIFVDGIHRLAVAKLLEIGRLPVCVLLRHEAWQARREQLVRGERLPTRAELEHPDLVYLNLETKTVERGRATEKLSR